MSDRNEHRLENRLKVHRAMHDLTQGELARRVGVTRKSINSIENGHFVPSTELALRMAQVLECTVEDLFQLPEARAAASV
jgi:putative transcriptional regulator